MILAEALLGAQTGQAVSYSRRKVFYVSGKRYRSPAYTYATVLRSVAELVQQGWLFEHRVKPNDRGWQSSFWAAPDLIQAACAFDAALIFDRGEPILLKDTAGDLVDYPETRETLRLRGALEPLNTYLKELEIELPGAVRQGRHLRIGELPILPIPGNGLHRIFSRGSFDYHGRAYAWWQNIPKKVRCDLLIDGETTAEADYTALHPAILYCKRGLKFDGDAYDVGDFQRDHVKQGFNIAVNSPNRRSAVYALAKAAGIGPSDANKLLAAIERRHKPISHAFCSDAGVRLMSVDSRLILSALQAANDDGFGALPIHDALVAPARSIGLAAEKMVQLFRDCGGARKSLSDQDKNGEGSTYGRRWSASPYRPARGLG
jgi:hypothetical protein